QPAAGGDDISKQAAFLQNKEVKNATFTGNVHLKSEMTDSGGGIVRGILLRAETVNYDKLTGQFEVPVYGEMLFQDHRPKSEQPSEQEKNATGTLTGGRGATAFKWHKSFTYEQESQKATMLGDV